MSVDVWYDGCIFMYEFFVAFGHLSIDTNVNLHKEKRNHDIFNMDVTTRHIRNLYMTSSFIFVPKMAKFESHQPKAYSPSILVKEHFCIGWSMRLSSHTHYLVSPFYNLECVERQKIDKANNGHQIQS